MNISWTIAWRYLFGKKSTNAIQIITGISIFGLGFGTAAIILILSVFNGFEVLLLSMYDSFSPDIKIVSIKGKSFVNRQDDLFRLTQIPGVDSISITLEELALFELNKRQEVGTLKGVDAAYNYVTGMDSAISRGTYLIQDEDINYGVFGVGMAYKLGLNVYDRLTSVAVYMPNLKKSSPLDKQFNNMFLYLGGTFAIQHDVDYEYVLAPLDAVQKLTKHRNKVSAFEIKLSDGADESSVIQEMSEIMGPEYLIKNRIDQQAATIKVMRLEKTLAFIILILALILVAFNLIGAIWMIVMDKRKDLAVLQAIGGRKSLVRGIILKLGSLICVLGFGMGLVLALVFYFLHKQFNIISMGPQSIVDAYPMELFWSDLPMVGSAVLIIGLLAILLPAHRASEISGKQGRLA